MRLSCSTVVRRICRVSFVRCLYCLFCSASIVFHTRSFCFVREIQRGHRKGCSVHTSDVALFWCCSNVIIFLRRFLNFRLFKQLYSSCSSFLFFTAERRKYDSMMKSKAKRDRGLANPWLPSTFEARAAFQPHHCLSRGGVDRMAQSVGVRNECNQCW